VEFVKFVESVGFVEFVGYQWRWVEMRWRYGGDTVEKVGIGDWRLWGMMLRDRQPSQWRASIVRFRASYFRKAA
jgi:hypothetical protein